MNNLDDKYIINSMTVIRTYIESLSKIAQNIHKGEELLDLDSKIRLKMDTLNYKNELKLSLLAPLFSNNYDKIIQTVDDEFKRKVLANEKINKSRKGNSFEDGSEYDIGTGINIIKIGEKAKNNPNKILILIRNSIAHSKFTLTNDEIHIVNRDFEAKIDIKWLEMMTLVIFSNSNLTDKKGAQDGFMMIHKHDYISIASEQELKYILKLSNYMEITYKEDQKVFMNDLIEGLGKAVSKYEKKGEILGVINQFNSQFNNSFDFKLQTISGDFLKMMDSSNFFFYNLDQIKIYFASKQNKLLQLDYYEVNENTFYKQIQILSNLHASYINKEKRNTLSYKYILEFILLIEQNKVNELNILNSDIIFFINTMQQLLIKAYCNLVFNYFIEKNKNETINVSDKLKNKYSLPNYVSKRKTDIKKLRSLLNTNLGGDEPQKILLKINKLLTEIDDYNNNRIDENKIVIEKLRNSFVHGNVEFSPISEISEFVIRDFEDNIQNFKLKIGTSDLVTLADDLYIDFQEQKSKVITNI